MKTPDEIEILHQLVDNVESGNYAINIQTEHIWKVDANDANTINLGTANGKKNVHGIVCNYCRAKVASKNYNGADDFVCIPCYNHRNN